MYVSWSSPKTDLVKNFSNLEALRTSFFSIVTFKLVFDIPLLNNLFAYFLNLSISLIELINTHQKLSLKEHKCTFKIDKIK